MSFPEETPVSDKRKLRAPALVVASVALVALLAGCSSSPATAQPTSTSATVISTASAATPATTASSASTSSSQAGSSPTTTEASTRGAAPSAAGGCAPNTVAIPKGATTAKISDVDGDGKTDTEFYSTIGGFKFGVRTASGATLTVVDPLAGPAAHGGWIATFEAHPPMAVLDDNREAALFSLVNCKFVTTADTNGEPYRFTLNGFGKYGTGVECIGGNTRGGRSLFGALATKEAGGRYKITTTEIGISKDGRTATNGPKHTYATTYAASSTQVKLAQRSSCEAIPIVHTNGE